MAFKLGQVSVQGHSHKKSKPSIPCQDAGIGGFLSNGNHVIVVSDGAGSSKQSHQASNFCVNYLFKLLQSIDLSFYSNKPADLASTEETWKNTCLDLFTEVRNALLDKAKNENIKPDDLYCTLILVVKTDWGFLSGNIGDGRSGFSDSSSKELIVPFMTFTAGATYFLIKQGWERIFRSYVVIPEFPELVEYFFASTDGCQDFVMDWSKKGSQNGIYDDVLGNEAFYDNNKPYNPFFEGLVKSLKEANSDEEVNSRLKNLVENGLYELNGEKKELKSISNPLLDDDKTLILFYKL